MAQLLLFGSTAECIVDDSDYSFLSKYVWFEWKLPKQNTSYVRKKLDGKQILLHRLISGCPDDMFVDHINGNGLDNRRENLRIVTKGQNNFNHIKYSGKSSKYLGVYFKKDRSKWGARARSPQGITHHLGYYASEEQAAAVYNDFCIRYNPHARLNQIYEVQNGDS